MATSITLTDERVEQLAAVQRPGVTRHRIGLAVLEVGLDVVREDPKKLDAKLAALVRETESRRGLKGARR
jgi:hypothetical protein